MFKQILQFIQNNPRSLWLLVFVGIPVVRGLMKALSDQKRKSDALAARKLAEAEAMRTGRPLQQAPSASPDLSARQRLEELAERRRQLLAQAQAQAQAQGQPPARVPAHPQSTRPPRLPAQAQRAAARAPSGPVRQVTLPGGIVLEVPVQTPSSPQSARQPMQPRPAPAGPRTSADKARASEKRRRHAEERVQADAESLAQDQRRRDALKPVEPEHEPTPAAPTPEARPRRAVLDPAIMFRPTSTAEWRKALVMNEILTRPVGMR